MKQGELNVLVGSRVKLARKNMGLTLEVVAKHLGFSNYQTLSKIESGERYIKASELSKFSHYFSKDLSYFFDEDLSNRPSLFAWRDKNDEESSEMLEAKIDKLLCDYKLLEELTNESKPVSFIPWEKTKAEITFNDLSILAKETIKRFKIEYNPSAKLAFILENTINIKIINYDLGETGSAVSTKGDFGYAIVINSKHAPWRRNFTLAHELFHLLSLNYYPLEELHIDKTSRRAVIIEQLANSFASMLLMPEDSILNKLKEKSNNKKIEWIDLVKIAIEFGVSTQALIWRLKTLKLINEKFAKSLLSNEEHIMINKTMRTNRNYPAKNYSNKFVWLGLKALNLGKISLGKFCNIFNISRADFSSFISERGDLENFDFNKEIELNFT